MSVRNPFNPIKLRKLLPLILILTLAAGFFPYQKAFAGSFHYQNYPKDTVGLARPEIGVTFVARELQLTESDSFYLTIDNKEVKGTKDLTQNKYSYVPVEDLKAGSHAVSLVLMMPGYQAITFNWTFTIANHAVASLPAEPTAEQQKGIDSINDYRKQNGLMALRWSAALSESARLHAVYLKNNEIDASQVSLHAEDNTKGSFVGTTPMERAHFVVYRGDGVGEDVSYGWNDISDAIDSLFDAPYHRSPFLLDDATEIGVHREGRYVVLEFGINRQQNNSMVVSPAPGDHYVPVAFDGHETPDPLRNHTGKASYPVGYPLMAVVNGPNIEKVTLNEASLTDGNGAKVELLTNTPANDDDLDNSVILIPVKPLQPDMLYSAHIKLTYLDDGQTKTVTKDWSFQTEPSPNIGKTMLHESSDKYVRQSLQEGRRSHVVTFRIGEGSYTLDGIRLPAVVKPVIIEDSTYLWVRDLAKALGAEVTWDDANQAAVYSKNGKTITFYTNKAAYASGGKEQATGSPARLVDDNTLIPVRLLSEALGAKVVYDDATQTITISY